MGSVLELGMLGPLEVRVDGGAPLTVRGQRLRALLALLALHAGEVLSKDRLVDELWGGNPSRAVSHSVQAAIYRLRSTLGVAGERLVTAPPGYCLILKDGEFDARRFEHLHKRGEAAALAGHSVEAAALLRDACNLWRGSALCDFTYDEFAQAEIARLEELRVSCREDLIDVELALGEHASLVPVLEALIRDHPLRERLHGQMMLALYRNGRQADALHAFQQARHRLLDAIAAEPGPALRDLELAILRQDSALLETANSSVKTPQQSMRPDRALPPALRTPPTTPYVGRESEDRVVGGAVDEACMGTRRVLIIVGESGLGKTRLAARAAMLACASGAAVSWATANQGLGAPYGLWVMLLSHLVEQAPPQVIEPVVARHGAMLSRLAPALGHKYEIASAQGSADAEAERYMMFQAVLALLESLSVATPVTLVFDDAQWADVPSLMLLQHVTRAAAHLGLLLVVTYRSSEVEPGHPLLDTLSALHRLDRVDRVALGGLSRDDVARLMTELAGHEMGAPELELSAAIADETGGNPFYVVQILRNLRSSGDIAQDSSGRWSVRKTAELTLPPSLREVVMQRVDSVGAHARLILGHAAVIGDAFTAERLGRVIDLSAEGDVGLGQKEVSDTLKRAVRQYVLVELSGDDGAFAFLHALFRHCLYEDLLVSERRLIHRHTISVIEEDADGRVASRAAELAHHAIAGRAEPERVVAYAQVAGEQSLTQLAPDHALRWFTEALDHLPSAEDGAMRCDLLIGLGTAKRQVGDPSFRDDLLEASATAEHLEDLGRMTRAVLANTIGPLGAAGPADVERIGALRRTLERLPETAPESAVVEAILAKETYYGGDPQGGVPLAQRALERARRMSDKQRLARVMSFTVAISPLEPLIDHAGLLDELASLAEQLDDPELQFRAASLHFIHSMHSGERDALDAAIEVMRTLAARIGQPVLRWTTLWAQSAQRWIDGALIESEELTMEAAHVATANLVPGAAVIGFGQHLAVLTEQGRLDELAPKLHAQLAINPNLPVLQLAKGFIDAEQGRLAEAAAVLEEHSQAGFKFGYDRTRAFNLARCADIAIRVGERTVARHLYGELLAHRRQFATPAGVSTRGSVELILGRLASALSRFEAADSHLEQAMQAHQRFRAPLLIARTHLASGESLLLRDDPALRPPAVSHLEKAAVLARRHGSFAVEREVDGLMTGKARVRIDPARG